ncbi:hypothetical protein BLX24_02445 [Arsenicibacter rosenii]|uniref:Uncharacterized protein n=1 Tax=Arsenicibacter rosenii TaxID=1750698 RepID=A0A1S2VQC5_9BACT|nr:hypothetical protein BLX24_02445 [Arsenicibacter rosenii]
MTATGNSTPFSYTWAAPQGITLSATSTSAVSASAGNGVSGVQTLTVTVAGAVFTGPGGYVYSSVYRRPGTYTVNVLNMKQPGTFTMTAATTNACGDRITDVITCTITGTGCN